MNTEDNLIKTFAKCFRLLTKLNAGIQDGFFVDLLAGESDKLLAEYMKFLKMAGKNKSNFCAYWERRDYRVAQYHGLKLISQIKSILNLLNILNYLDLIKPATFPFLERELLKLQLSLLNYNWPGLLSQNDRSIEKDDNLLAKKNNKNTNKNVEHAKLNESHKQIAEFIKNKENVQNIEVFSRFSSTTRRTLKRKLSELIKAGVIKRQVKGKEVYYLSH